MIFLIAVDVFLFEWSGKIQRVLWHKINRVNELLSAIPNPSALKGHTFSSVSV